MSRSKSTRYNFAFTGGVIVDGRCISPRGYDVTDDLRAHADALPWEREPTPTAGGVSG